MTKYKMRFTGEVLVAQRVPDTNDVQLEVLIEPTELILVVDDSSPIPIGIRCEFDIVDGRVLSFQEKR